MKKNLLNLTKLFGLLAVFVSSSSVNTTCIWLAHQPEVPSKVKSLKH